MNGLTEKQAKAACAALKEHLPDDSDFVLFVIKNEVEIELLSSMESGNVDELVGMLLSSFVMARNTGEYEQVH